ncbi:MAG: beta-Ala-His dipeptidase [Sedimentibacter sp.]
MINSDKVFYYFKEISKIPRETGKEKGISNYLKRFAEERDLEVNQDELFNIIIKRKSNIKNYNGPTLILQGHMDMVYEKDEGSDHLYESGIELIEKDGYLYGNHTTLGADNGIAVAYCLAILDSGNFNYPNLEIVITTQEEGGLVGVKSLDTSNLIGKYLINLDAEEEDVYFTSCAGGVRNYIHVPISKYVINNKCLVTIKISDLKGGHSGLEIDLERGNAIKLMGRILYKINYNDLDLYSIESKGKANAISNKAIATIAIPRDKILETVDKIVGIEKLFKKELQFSDQIRIEISVDESVEQEFKVFTKDTKDKIINTIMLMPNGVINKDMALPGLVQTSINIGSLEEVEDKISILSSIRSSVESQKYYITDVIRVISNLNGAKCEFFNDYPQWEYKPDSKLRDLITQIYEEIYKVAPKFTAIHAGLECGYLDKKLDNVDIISMGANLYDVHTTKERASIESINKVWNVIIKLLEKLSEF